MSYLDILILRTLQRGPAHGYEIRQKVEWIHSGLLSLNPNVLYPALHRFEAMGALDRTVEPQKGRPPRHVYELTAKGEELLHDLVADLAPADAVSEAEFKTRVAMFDLLDQGEQLAILDVRAVALDGLLAQLQRFSDRTTESDWDELVRTQAVTQYQAERDWVDLIRRRVEEGPA